MVGRVLRLLRLPTYLGDAGMTLVLSIQPYVVTSYGSVFQVSTITIDCDDTEQPLLFLPLIERHLKKCKADGLISDGMLLSACLWNEKCNPDTMVDTSEIVTWFSTAVANLHDDESAWW
jgi:hypothetical protein